MSVYRLPNYHYIEEHFCYCVWTAKGKPEKRSPDYYKNLAIEFMQEHESDLFTIFDKKYSSGEVHNMVRDFFDRQRGYKRFCERPS